MKFTKLKMPSQTVLHYCGEGDESCLNLVQPMQHMTGEVYYSTDWLKKKWWYEEVKRRGLVLGEEDTCDMEEDMRAFLEMAWSFMEAD